MSQISFRHLNLLFPLFPVWKPRGLRLYLFLGDHVRFPVSHSPLWLVLLNSTCTCIAPLKCTRGRLTDFFFGLLTNTWLNFLSYEYGRMIPTSGRLCQKSSFIREKREIRNKDSFQRRKLFVFGEDAELWWPTFTSGWSFRLLFRPIITNSFLFIVI